MDAIWLLRGAHAAPGWDALEADSKAKRTEVILFDRDAWALVRAAEAPRGYAGLAPEVPAPGLYISSAGLPCYVANGAEVRDGRAVLDSLGDEGRGALATTGDPDEALMRLGRAY